MEVRRNGEVEEEPCTRDVIGAEVEGLVRRRREARSWWLNQTVAAKCRGRGRGRDSRASRARSSGSELGREVQQQE